MYNDYRAMYHDIWIPKCIDCKHYCKAGELADTYGDEIDEAGIDYEDMVCSNFYSDNFLERVDDTDVCDVIDEKDR